MSSSSFCAESAPTRVAAEFYEWVIGHDGGGLPKESDLKSLKKILSTDLVYLLHASLAAEERCAALAPRDIKPLMFEGSIFVGNYESLTKVISLDEKKVDEKFIINARLRNSNPKDATDIIDWLDSVTLIRENDKYVISNIEYANSKRTLVKILKKYISKKECGI
ncbi:hypothetical protein [Undibacterium sp. Ren11W]|uniref:hypothetical protein n=1 Tax=Undibacterium sp. Ren11W TaxID=3413045 RepID=UPI003BF0280D